MFYISANSVKLLPHWERCEGSAADPVKVQIFPVSCAASTVPVMWTLTHYEIPLSSQKAVAVAGQEALLSRLSQTQEACDHLKEQLEALRRHSLSLQDSCTSLQTLNTQLQVIMAEFHNLVHLNQSKWTSC